MSLIDRIATVDAIQARRYGRLSGVAWEIATVGINRHFDACDRVDTEPDTAAIREIIDDALQGRAVYAEMGQPIAASRPPLSRHTRLVDQPWVDDLLALDSFTMRDVEAISGRDGHDALASVRQCKELELLVVGELEGRNSPKLYKLERVEEEA